MSSSHATLRRGNIARSSLLVTFALAVAGLLAATPARALGVWYVDNTNPLASDTGLGLQKKPYRTIGGALAAHPDSGVTLIVRGGPYREKVVVTVDGSGSQPIFLRTNGTPVVIDGADDFGQPAQWAQLSGSVWLAAAVTWDPQYVFADDVRLTPSAGAPADLQAGQWTWVPGSGLYLNTGGGNPAAHAPKVCHRTHGFFVSGRAHVFIDGFTILRAQEKGIELIGDSDVVVKRNVIRQCGSAGIGVRASRRVQVYGNTVSENNHHGIELREGTTASLIDHNESFANAHQGEAWRPASTSRARRTTRSRTTDCTTTRTPGSRSSPARTTTCCARTSRGTTATTGSWSSTPPATCT